VESRLAATGLLLSVADRRGRVSEGEREKGRVRGCKRERKGRKTRQKKRELQRVAYQQRPRVLGRFSEGGVVSEGGWLDEERRQKRKRE